MLFAEGVIAQHAAMFIFRRTVGRAAAKGGDFDQVLAKHHMHDLEAAANDEGAPEQTFDFVGRGVGGHVEIFRLDAQQQVAYGAADDEGLEAGLLQRVRNAHRVWRHMIRIDLVLAGAEHNGFGVADGFGRNAEYAANKFINHRTGEG